MRLQLNPRKIAVVLGCIAVLLALQSLYAEYVLSEFLGLDANTAPTRILDIFSVSLEESLPTWYSTINLFLAAGLLAWIAVSKRLHGEPYSLRWAGLSLVFLYLSMDEGAAIHETASSPLRDAFDTSGFLEFGWLIVGVPLVLLFLIAYFRFWTRLPKKTRILFAAAAILYIGGGMLIESVSANQYDADGGASFVYMAIATVEELCEMLGVVVLIYALLDYLSQREALLVVDTAERLTEYPPVKLGWRWSLPRTAAIFAAALFLINGGLLVWGFALKEPAEARIEAAAAAPYHFYVLVDELGREGVTITHFSGTFNPVDAYSRRTAVTLIDAYPSVQILSLPAQEASIAFAGDAPVLTEESVTDLMAWIEESEYIFYDTPAIRAMIGLP